MHIHCNSAYESTDGATYIHATPLFYFMFTQQKIHPNTETSRDKSPNCQISETGNELNK